MAFISIDDFLAGSKEIRKGDLVALLDPAGKIKIGTVKIKRVKSKKKEGMKKDYNEYAYAQYRDGDTIKQKYIGGFYADDNRIYKKR